MPKPINKEQGLSLLKLRIKTGARHEDYARVCEIAKTYKAYVTGENVADLLKRFVPRESEELFKQRINLTSLNTPDIANTLATPMYKVGRTTATKSITWSSADKTAAYKKALEEVSNKFFGDMSVDNYLTYRMVQLDQQDPNSFIVVEFEEAVDPSKPLVKANPYPFEVNAKNAIDFEYVNNLLQYLLVLNDNENRYTLYLENESITADKKTKEEIAQITTTLSRNQEIWYADPENKDTGYLITTHSHNAGKIPARRVGTVMDPLTGNRTCVPMIHPAACYFEKAIKTVSELDITNALHTFPKVFRYGNICPGNMREGLVCNNGFLQGEKEGEKCPICKGSGFENQTTAAEEVIVKAPKELKDMVNLDFMMTYKAPPIDLIEFQKKFGLYDLKELGIKAVYNGDTYVRDTTAATATEKNIDLESVYDTLKPFADSWSNMWMHIMELVAIYRDMGKGISVVHAFPKDFKMETLQMLFTMLKAANDSGAPSYIKASITADIAKKIYVDQPLSLLKIQVKDKFYPFTGKSENEINYLLANGLVSRFNKILYAAFDPIFTEIEQEQADGEPSFYELEFQKQKGIVTGKVDEIITVLDQEEAATTPPPFNIGGPDANA